jgi:hypothetical protein
MFYGTKVRAPATAGGIQIPASATQNAGLPTRPAAAHQPTAAARQPETGGVSLPPQKRPRAGYAAAFACPPPYPAFRFCYAIR